MKAVRFLTKQSPYNAGEIAGFPDELADRYVNAKLAEFVSSLAASEAEMPKNPAEWEQLLRDCVDHHEKRIKDLQVLLAEVKTERDGLKGRVIELESQLTPQTSVPAAGDGPRGPDGAPIDVTAKAEGEKPAGNEPAAGADTSANLQPSAANEPAASSGAQEVLGGTEAAPAGSGKKTGRK
jgi:hypothetical protein